MAGSWASISKKAIAGSSQKVEPSPSIVTTPILIISLVYTTLAPVPTLATAANKRAAQSTSASDTQPLPNKDVAGTPQVAPTTGEPVTGSHQSKPTQSESSTEAPPISAQRSISDIQDYGTIADRIGSTLPSTPPSNNATHRVVSASSAPRSMSMISPMHETSPVMNETLSVIEEHITDMHTPRHSFLTTRDQASGYIEGSYGARVPSRLSYINGHETDEEESGTYSEKEVLTWGPEQVARLLEERGADQQQCQVFRDEEITGEVLLNLDQSSLMLKQFELGKMGRRLALWHKIHEFQLEVRGPRPRTQPLGFGAGDPRQDAGRGRSTSFGLPRIPSLMEGTRPPNGHQSSRSISEQIQAGSDTAPTHSPRPSAASIRNLNHNRRHSSINRAPSPGLQSSAALAKPPVTQGSHAKQGSFDRTWTMASNYAPSEDRTISSSHLHTPSMDSTSELPSPGNELGMTVVSSLDLDRGYFSGNEVENRRARNVLQKRNSPTHARAPSDSFGNRRTSHVFRHQRTGSTESLDTMPGGKVSAAQVYYGSYRPGSRSTSSPQFTKTLKASGISPTVTKLEYGESPSIDAIAASPNVPASETSSIEKPTPSPALVNRFMKYRATGLRAISDAVTGDEKALAASPAEKAPEGAKDSPIQSPSRTESSTPSLNSKSLDMDDSSILKSATGSSGGQRTPLTATSATVPKRKHKKQTSAYMRGLEQKAPKEQMIGCDYSGWMKKKSSNLMTTWKSRLFVLRGRRLSYYYSEDDTEEKGLIDISFHRVLPANNDRITGLHAAFTGAAHSPTSPHNAQIETTAASDAAKAADTGKKEGTPSGMFIFKLVPPRSGLSKAVNFTKPTVHYFAVDSVQQGRLWMAALMKATIDRDETKEVITTYNQKTISLFKAKAMKQRPPDLMELEDDEKKKKPSTPVKDPERGLGLTGLQKETGESLNGDKKEDSLNTDDADSGAPPQSVGASSEFLDKETTVT